jgi:hypothetical protein
MILCLLPTLAAAAQPRVLWSFAWDSHPQAALVEYFELELCLPAGCTIARIPGGSATTVRDIRIPPTVAGNGTAVLRACAAALGCSGNSNTVTIDRTPPLPPTAVLHGFNDL